MEVYFKQIIANVEKSIISDIANNDTDVINEVLAAYNWYQEDEKDGADYLFNLGNQEDLICMVKGGLTAAEIADAWKKIQKEHITPYFHFGVNYHGLSAAGDFNKLKATLISWLDEIIPCVIKYAPMCPEYAVIYQRYITYYLEEKFNKNNININ